MIFRSGFHKILNKCFQHKYHIFKAGHLLQPLDQYIHRAFRLCQRHLPILIPEILSPHHGIRLFYFRSLSLKQQLRQFIKCIIRITCHSPDLKPLHNFHQGQLHNHVVCFQHPFTVRQLLKLLNDIHVIDKVHTRFFRQIHGTLLYSVTGVGQYIQVSCKTEIL